MEKPTQQEIEIALKVIEWFKADTEENEPHAFSDIAAAEQIITSLGCSM